MNDISISGKDWISKNYSEEKLNFLKDNFNLSEVLSKLIAIRNIRLEEVKLFLEPKIKNLLPNPFVLKGMEKAVSRTIKAINENQKIAIFETTMLMVLPRQLFLEIISTKLNKK